MSARQNSPHDSVYFKKESELHFPHLFKSDDSNIIKEISPQFFEKLMTKKRSSREFRTANLMIYNCIFQIRTAKRDKNCTLKGTLEYNIGGYTLYLYLKYESFLTIIGPNLGLYVHFTSS